MGGERHCESKVSSPRTQPGLEPTPVTGKAIKMMDSHEKHQRCFEEIDRVTFSFCLMGTSIGTCKHFCSKTGVMINTHH